MTRVFYREELEGIATYWRIYRKDGVTLGFTSHDHSIAFGGIDHRSAPGMTPSAIRRTSGLTAESAEVEGVLSHDSITAGDLEAGLYDGARIEIGIVDWETAEHSSLYAGSIGEISEGISGFTAELHSFKSALERDIVPRTSPTCRAEFCGRGCNLSASQYRHRAIISAVDHQGNAVTVPGIQVSHFLDGRLRFLEGPQTGVTFGIIRVTNNQFFLDRPITSTLGPGLAVELLEGCDHTLATCASRFSNAVNFRGEPFLPGNDLLARYAQPR